MRNVVSRVLTLLMTPIADLSWLRKKTFRVSPPSWLEWSLFCVVVTFILWQWYETWYAIHFVRNGYYAAYILWPALLLSPYFAVWIITLVWRSRRYW